MSILLVMLAAAAATFLLSYAETYPQFLLAALGVGIAGGSFAVGVTYVSKFYPAEKQGTALGIFGAGNVGAAVTKFVAPFVLLASAGKPSRNIGRSHSSPSRCGFYLVHEGRSRADRAAAQRR